MIKKYYDILPSEGGNGIDTELMDDMICYDPYATIFGKARRVYILCVKAGKTELARKIWNKHSKYKSQQSDFVTSFGMMLTAQNKRRNNI